MFRKLVFATNNPHKLREIRDMSGDSVEIVSLAEIGCSEDIPETSDTLRGNALQKARYVADKYGLPCFADDTGLMVDALNGEPGVLSARYALANNYGRGHDSMANSGLLLERLTGITNRRAHFSTAIALVLPTPDGTPAREYIVEGRIDGFITQAPSGTDGFGYDPVFIPDGSNLTFAQMTADEKNSISHRRRAAEALFDLLNSLAETSRPTIETP